MKRYFTQYILLIFFFSAFPFSPYVSFAFTDPRKVLVIFTLIFLFFSVRSFKKSISLISLLLVLFSIFAISSILWTKSIYTYGDELFVYIFPLISLFVIGSHFRDTIFKKILYFILGIGLFYIIYGMFQYFDIDFYFFRENVGRYRMIGLMGNPIYFSEYILPIFILFLSIFAFSQRKWERVLSGIAFFLLGWILIATLSRGSWVGALFGVSMIGVLWSRERGISFWKISIPIYTFIFTVIFSLPRYRTRFFSIFNFHESSIYRRFMIWLISLTMFRDHLLLGVGCGGYKYLFLKYQAMFFSTWGKNLGFPAGKALKAHNDIIEMFTELGIIGGIIFSLLIYLFVIEGWKSIKIKDGFSLYRKGFYVGTLSMLVDGLTGFPVRITPSAILFWLFFGLSLVNVRDLKKVSIDKRFQRVFKWFMIVLLVIYFFFLLQNYFALVYERLGEGQFLKKKNIEPAKYLFEKAVKLMPLRGIPHFYLGSIFFLEGDIDRGIKEMEAAQKSFDHQEIHAALGYNYLLKGRYRDAIEEYKKAIMYKKQKDPHYKVKYLTDIGLCYKNLGNYREAEHYYKEALSIDPEFVNALYNLGVLYDIIGKKDDAYVVFRRLFDVVKKDGKIDPEELMILKKIAHLGYIKLKVE